MSDGMSDSRAYDTEHEKWDEVEGIKLKKPIDVYFYHYRDGVVGECLHLDIEFFASRWGATRIAGGMANGGDAIAFTGQNSEEIARDAMKKLMVKKLGLKKYQEYLK